MKGKIIMNKKILKEICLTGMLIALCTILRYVFSFLPNIQPITAIIILVSLFISRKISILTSMGLMIITGIILGFGIWIPLQILGYIIICLGTLLIIKRNIILTLTWGIIGSYIYGFVVSLSMLPYIPNNTFISTWILGLPFDTYHAISTFIFILALYYPFKKVSFMINTWLK